MSDPAARSAEFPFNQRVAEAVSMGIPLEAIVQHLSESQKPSDKLFVQEFKALQTSNRAPSRMANQDTGKPLSKEQSMLQDVYNFAEENPITTAGIATAGAGAAAIAGYALKERIKSNAEIRKEKELAKIGPSEAVKLQRDQLDFQKEKFATEQQAIIDKEVKNAVEQARKQQAAAAQSQQTNLTPQEVQARANSLKPTAPATPTVAPVAPAIPMTPEQLNASFAGNAPQAGPAGSAMPPKDMPPQFGPAGPGVGVPPSPPYMPDSKQNTGISETLASGGDVKQAIQQNLAQEIDKPDMRPTYQRNKENPIGPQAYNWVAGQQGPKAAEVWQNIVGDKNVPYGEFMDRYKTVYEGAYGAGYGDPDPFNQPAKNSSYRKPSMIPSQIKGAASPSAMGASALAAVIPALAVAGVEGYKGNKELVNRELKDAWNSLKSVVTWPYDVSKAATKGDFGPLKDVLMSVNPATLLLNEANKNDKKTIEKMIADERQAAKVGAGRGIAPPSAYQR